MRDLGLGYRLFPLEQNIRQRFQSAKSSSRFWVYFEVARERNSQCSVSLYR